MWDRFLKVFTCMPASLNVWHKVSLTQMECTCVCQTTFLGGQGPLGVPLIPFLNPPFLPPVRPQPKSQPMITEMEQRWTSGVNGVILNSALNISFAPLSSPYEIENGLPASPLTQKWHPVLWMWTTTNLFWRPSQKARRVKVCHLAIRRHKADWGFPRDRRWYFHAWLPSAVKERKCAADNPVLK